MNHHEADSASVGPHGAVAFDDVHSPAYGTCMTSLQSRPAIRIERTTMNHRQTPCTPRLASAAALAVAAALACASAQAQSWEYKSYKKTLTGQFNKDVFTPGSISVEEKDGASFFRMTAGPVDACLRGAIPANVVKTAETTTIEPQIALAGCELFRYVIRNDGSGGAREVKRGDQWVDTKWDHGLTPKK